MVWIVDICGPQSGIYEPLFTWKHYKECFVAEAMSAFPLERRSLVVKYLPNIDGFLKLTYGLIRRAMRELN